MKKITFCLLAFLGFIFNQPLIFAQSDIVSTIAGGGTLTGDGVPATSSILSTSCFCLDAAGNIYFSDNNYIRKVTAATGLVSTIAGNGTSGFSGDGGPATAAAFYFNSFNTGIYVDGPGNVYVGDFTNNRIRVINHTTNIISTYAGGGSVLGDGGPATNAAIIPVGIIGDGMGNMYFADDQTYRIRKINMSTGIITTVGGNGASVDTGDGGPATNAGIYMPQTIGMDAAGNIYVSEGIAGNAKIRKIDMSNGKIYTVAGNGIGGESGDGGPATAAEIALNVALGVDLYGNVYLTEGGSEMREVNAITDIINSIGNSSGSSANNVPATSAQIKPDWIYVDVSGNIYFTEGNKIRKITFNNTTIASFNDSFNASINELCNGPELAVITPDYLTGKSMKTYFGDGTTDSSAIIPNYIGGGYVIINHTYPTSATYLIKQILYNGSAPIDSVTFSYDYSYCRTLPFSYYYDGNTNCIKDPTEPYITLPLTVEVDSNGIFIDSLSATSGLNYNAYGAPGDIYTIKLIGPPVGLESECPSSGIFSDTLQSSNIAFTDQYMGLICSSTSNFDLAVYASMICGVHASGIGIVVNNTYCTPEDAVLTMNIDSKYAYADATPAPYSVSGNTVTWYLSDVSAIISEASYIRVGLINSGPRLTIGDTVLTSFSVTPTTGDVNLFNNVEVIIDTVKSSYDPNEMSVAPGGYILSGTQLQYTIEFENTGNDTAHNIYVMDTLSDNVDVPSLKIVTSPGVMNVGYLKYSGHNIVQFNFPNINLLDSSYHNQCTDMVIFNVATKNGLPDGTTIFNHAGIFFDNNPVVMTGTVEDIIGSPAKIPLISNSKEFQIFPNPATDILTITTGPGSYNSCMISNTLGQALMQQEINAAQTYINIKMLPDGLYYITMKGSNGNTTRKFIKMSAF